MTRQAFDAPGATAIGPYSHAVASPTHLFLSGQTPVDGATANALPDPVPDALREERRARFMAVQATISAAKLARRVGETVDVLVDGLEAPAGRARKATIALARTAADAPEIDGVVRIREAAHLAPGAFASVRITGADAHDLTAELA